MWWLVTALCAMYVFAGIAVVVYAAASGNAVLIVLTVVAYVLNLVVLQYANKKDW